jgi:hypothetical protein
LLPLACCFTATTESLELCSKPCQTLLHQTTITILILPLDYLKLSSERASYPRFWLSASPKLNKSDVQGYGFLIPSVEVRRRDCLHMHPVRAPLSFVWQSHPPTSRSTLYLGVQAIPANVTQKHLRFVSLSKSDQVVASQRRICVSQNPTKADFAEPAVNCKLPAYDTCSDGFWASIRPILSNIHIRA